MKPTCSVLLLMAGIAASLLPSATAQQFEELVTKVPSSANAIVFLNIDKILASDMAVKENWKTEHRRTYQSGLTFLPPNARFAVLSAQMNYDTMLPFWSMAVMSLDHVPSLPAIVHISGGHLEGFGKYAGVALPGNSFLVQFAPQVVATIGPANRQGVARWVKEVDASKEHRLTSYLQEAYAYANEVGTPIVLAADLEDVIPMDDIRLTLQESETYSKIDPKAAEELSKLLAGVRGIVLGITLDADKPFGKVKVDFTGNVALDPEQAKALLLHLLVRRGAMLDELNDWTPKVGAHFITMEGFLTRSGMIRLSSLIERPPAFIKEAQVATAVETAPNQSQSQSQSQYRQSQGSVPISQEYYVRVNDLIEDLQKKPRESPNYTTGQIALWYDSYARKIDQLPVAGVDPELASFADFASDSLRAASARIRASNIRKRVRQVSTPVPYDVYTYGNTYGYTDVFGGAWAGIGDAGTIKVPDYRAYQQSRTAAGAQERTAGLTDAKDILSKLDEASGDIRRKMSQKYKVDF